MFASFTIRTSPRRSAVTFIFVIIAVPGEIILGLILAVLFNRSLPLRGAVAHHH